ncbi:MAG: methylated-DNA--[protein]-cysteine S-methyltransferase [Muribaculaceae bacterium]|nr:methylated-DNA--[protein]-cysteine S-methyltransferase [Muribaculaceae bacterium]
MNSLGLTSTIYESPIGPLMLAASPVGLQICDRPAGPARFTAPASGSVLAEACRQLDEYFSGRRRVFDVPLDPWAASDFSRDVYAALSRVPYGSTVTYGDLAARLGCSGAQRAVAAALGANRLSIFIPCHRVVAARGSGGYRLGLPAKLSLLALEAENSIFAAPVENS